MNFISLSLTAAMYFASSLCVSTSVLAAEPEAASAEKTNLEVIEILMPRPMMKLDFRDPESKIKRGATRHCIQDTGTRLRHRGDGQCVVGSGLSVRAKDMKHRGWEDLSPSANAMRPRNR